MSAASSIAVELSSRTVDLPLDTDAVRAPWARAIVAPGAGAGRGHPFLEAFARTLAEGGVTVVRFDFPYRVLGRRMPGSTADAVAAWAAVRDACEADDLPTFAIGKSYGGRMASLAADEGVLAAAGLVYLGYPLHAPGRPDRPRGAHLSRIGLPQLFLEGTRDRFIQPVEQFDAVVAECPDAEVVWVPGGDHSFAVAGRRMSAEDSGAESARAVLPWVRQRAGGRLSPG